MTKKSKPRNTQRATGGGGKISKKPASPKPAANARGDFFPEEPVFDLFGNPADPNHGKRGRPRHIPTDENRNKIMQLLSLGWDNERIASALGMSAKTLRKHYLPELNLRDIARDRVFSTQLNMLWHLARGGNVAAMKEYNRIVEKADIAAAEREFNRKSEANDTPVKPLGKKEQALIDAQTAGEGSDWGSDLQPRTVN